MIERLILLALNLARALPIAEVLRPILTRSRRG
jgi:hypothetical protein